MQNKYFDLQIETIYIVIRINIIYCIQKRKNIIYIESYETIEIIKISF